MSEIGIKDQKFSVEVSFTGLSRAKAAKTLGKLFGAEPEYLKGTYDTWTVKDQTGKTWRLTYDPIVKGEWKVWDAYLTRRDRGYRVRLTAPMLNYGDMAELRDCLLRLHDAGARVNNSCEMSVHVDASGHNRQSLKNLIGIMYSKEDILFRALKVNEERASVYSKKVREPLIQQTRRLSSDETKDLTLLEEIWYEGRGRSARALDRTGRYALNLHSVFFRNTVEWRCFNATLQPDRAAAYVNLCLAMSAQAVAQRSATLKKTESENEAFTFRTWLVRLGLNGEEYKITRELLLENLEGNRAWRHGKTPDDGQKNRKKRKGTER